MDNYTIDENYLIMYKMLKYGLFSVVSYIIILFTIEMYKNDNKFCEEKNNYDMILIITILIVILFYILDLVLPVIKINN